MAQAEKFKVHGHCDPRVIDAFGPILRDVRENVGYRFFDGAFFGYPQADGVLFIATNGTVLAAYLDRSAKLTSPAQFLLPEAVIAACAPPKGVTGWYEGDEVEFQLPEWAQPGRASFSDGGVFVSPKMHHPSDSPEYSHVLCSYIASTDNVYRDDDYRASHPTLDPRRPFAHIEGKGAPGYVDPVLISLFSRSRKVFNAEGATSFQPHGVGKPVTVLFEKCPDFLGLVMPMNCDHSFALPDYAVDRQSVAA